MERKLSLLFASLKDWRTGGPFMYLVIHFCLQFIRQNQGRLLTLALCIPSLVWKSAWGRRVWQFIIPHDDRKNWTGGWWEYYFFSIIAVKFFSCSCFLVLNSLVHTPTPPSGPQPTVLLSLPRMERDTSALLLTFFMLAYGVLCCWFSPTAPDALSTCSLGLICW